MILPVLPLSGTEIDSVDCIHHWVIEPPNGTDLLVGFCKKCWEIKKNFKASFEQEKTRGYEIKIESLEKLQEEELSGDDEEW